MKSIWLKLLGLIKGNKVTTFIVVLVLALLAIVYFQQIGRASCRERV